MEKISVMEQKARRWKPFPEINFANQVPEEELADVIAGCRASLAFQANQIRQLQNDFNETQEHLTQLEIRQEEVTHALERKREKEKLIGEIVVMLKKGIEPPAGIKETKLWQDVLRRMRKDTMSMKKK